MKEIVSVMLFTLLLSSCAPVYLPNQLQTPLLRDKGEATASISIGTSTFDIQTAYSPIKHLDILVDFTVAKGESHEHAQFQGGLGYYKTFNDAFHLEFLAGGGGGYSTTITLGTFGKFNEGTYSRFYLQPNVFFVSEHFDFGLATRASFVHFNNFGRGTYVEPTLVGRFGFEYLKFQVQAGLSFQTNDNATLDYNPIIFNLGLVYTLRKH